MTTTFVGLDVSKTAIEGVARPGDAVLRVPYTDDGIAGLVTKLQELEPTLVVLEATGGYEVQLATALAIAG